MIGEKDGRQRVVIENVSPEINCGMYPVKRCIGEKITVEADIFCDGHDSIAAELLYRKKNETQWNSAAMTFLANDRWQASFKITDLCSYLYSVRAWVDHFITWQKDIAVKARAGQDTAVDILIGVDLIKQAAGRAQDDISQRLSRFAEHIAGDPGSENVLSLILSAELTELMASCPDRRFAVTYDKELTATVDRAKAFSAPGMKFFRAHVPKTAHGTALSKTAKKCFPISPPWDSMFCICRRFIPSAR
jgi:starch synthase (maltosyl-transferring)